MESDARDAHSPVLIVGGGLAGIATAVALAQRGIRCRLLESRPRLGGRASSFLDQGTGQWIDNCQHVSMGCCTNFRALAETTGIARGFRRERVLYFVAPDGRINRFAASPLPAPLHLSLAFAGLSYLTWREKASLGWGLRQLARSRTWPDGQTIGDWLRGHGQSERSIERFWNVVLVSALSEALDRISVAAARKVFVDGFLAHRHAWEVDVPTVPLEQLYGEHLATWCEAHGVEICCRTAAEQLEIDGGRVGGVRLSEGRRLAAEDYVIAVPPQRLHAILPEPLKSELAGVERLEYAPISSIHLWFDRGITPLPHAAFTHGLVQWVFNRTALSERGQPMDDGWYYQVVISASREVIAQGSEAVLATVLAELARVWPAVGAATLKRHRQVTEHRAVFSMTPDCDACRPPQQTSLPELQLAGDYTQTGWPATMEGAVRSGFLAAENILRRRGRPANVLQPDLPVSSLSRWMFRL